MVKILEVESKQWATRQAELRGLCHQRRATLRSLRNGEKRCTAMVPFCDMNNLQSNDENAIRNHVIKNNTVTGQSSKTRSEEISSTFFHTVQASKCLKKSKPTERNLKNVDEETERNNCVLRKQANQTSDTVVGSNIVENVINESFTKFTKFWKVIFGDSTTPRLQVMTSTSYSCVTEGRYSTPSQTSIRKRNYADDLDRFYDFLNSGIKVTRENIPSKKLKRGPMENCFEQDEEPKIVLRSFEADEELED